jgi:hypothetical protein
VRICNFRLVLVPLAITTDWLLSKLQKCENNSEAMVNGKTMTAKRLKVMKLQSSKKVATKKALMSALIDVTLKLSVKTDSE